MSPQIRIPIARPYVTSLIIRHLNTGPLYRVALELIVDKGDLTHELRALCADHTIEIAKDIGPATYRLTTT